MTIDQYLTVEKSSPTYRKLILGYDEVGRIPVLVQGPCFQPSNPFVTFQFVLAKSVQRPHILPLLLRAIRIEMLPFTLGPAVVGYLLADPVLTQLASALYVFASLFFLHIGVFCLNDYFDHVLGVDSVNEKVGSRVIQEGWLRAWQVRAIGVVFLLLAALVAIPVFRARPELIGLAVITLGLLGAGYLFSRGKNKIPVLSMFVLFILFGPALSLGTFWFFNGAFDRDAWAFGTLLGFMTIAYVFNRQILSLVEDQLAQVQTLPVVLGVDLSRKLLMFGIGFTAFAVVGHIGSESLTWGLITALILFLPVRKIRMHLQMARSPMSSAMSKNRIAIQSLYLVTAGAIVLFILGRSMGFAP